MDYSNYGYTPKVQAEIERRAAEREAARQATLQAEKDKNHRAWLRLCGAMAPIGKLTD